MTPIPISPPDRHSVAGSNGEASAAPNRLVDAATSQDADYAGGSASTIIVIPCFNEVQRLPADEITAFLRDQPDIGVCLVDDGSRDGTIDVLREIERAVPASTEVLRLPANVGKGNAVRAGILHATEAENVEFVGYWDADLSTPLREISRFIDLLSTSPSVHLLCGCRLARLGSDIRRKAHRHYLGRCFATLASLALNLVVYDSQCGAKLFRASLAREVFTEEFFSLWLFDLEILGRILQSHGREAVGRIVCEVPLLQWVDMGKSKVKARHCVRCLLDIARIACRYRNAPDVCRAPCAEFHAVPRACAGREAGAGVRNGEYRRTPARADES